MTESIQSSTILEHYDVVNCDFVVCDDIKIENSFGILQAVDQVGKNETPFYIQQGQYIVPVDSRGLQENSKQYIVKDIDECTNEDVNQTIIFCTPEQYAEYSQLFSNDEEQDVSSIVTDGAVEDEGLTNDDIQTVPVQDASELEDSNESNPVVEYVPYGKLLHRPNYQYAVLKNGRLHLQTLNVEEEERSYLKEQLDAFQASINFDSGGSNVNNNSKVTALDLNKITGRNLITGQTVTLDKYMNKLLCNAEKSCINKKVVIGKTSKGKKLVGKILHVKKGVPAVKALAERGPKILNTEPNKPVVKSTIGITAKSLIDSVGNILVTLMNLQNIHQKLYHKRLKVKLYRSTNSSQKGILIKSAFSINGYMEKLKDKWHFVGTKVEDCKQKNIKHALDYEDRTQELQNNDTQLENIVKDGYETGKRIKVSDTEVVHLTLVINISEDGKIVTKVHFGCKSFALEQGSGACEIEIHNKLFGCDGCFKTFQDENLLFQHKKIHHTQRWYTVCTVCNKEFTSAGSLKRHLTTHDPSLRPLECTVCLQRFTDQSGLKKHLLIHTGIRAFICKVCHRSFINRGDLNFHSRIHDPVKLFFCEVCGREFSRQSNLFRHTEIHRGKSALFQCHICGCSYSFPSSLTRHIVHKHLGNFSTIAQT